MRNKVVFLPLLILLFSNSAYGQELPIALTSNLDDVDFDGIWSYETEWKPGSVTKVKSDTSDFVIKYAHDYENLFIFVSVVSDITPSRISDKAIICIDSKNDGGNVPKKDDFCFMAKIGSDEPITLRGGGQIATQGFFEKIPSHPELIAIGGTSGPWDRYSKTPHSSYEFKIPLEIIGRSDSYGFFILIHDSGDYFGWPNVKLENYPFIPEPNKWGQLVSPDKSIPEFDQPFLMLLPAVIFVAILSNFFSKKFSRFS